MELSSHLHVVFNHEVRLANNMVDALAKQGGDRASPILCNCFWVGCKSSDRCFSQMGDIILCGWVILCTWFWKGIFIPLFYLTGELYSVYVALFLY